MNIKGKPQKRKARELGGGVNGEREIKSGSNTEPIPFEM